MEEVEGKSWTEIQKAIREITGKQFSGSLLVAQYLRMKEDMVLFEVEKSDVCLFTPCSPELAIRYLTWWSGHGLILLMLGRSRFLFSARRTSRNGLNLRNGRRSRMRLNPGVEISTLLVLVRTSSMR